MSLDFQINQLLNDLNSDSEDTVDDVEIAAALEEQEFNTTNICDQNLPNVDIASDSMISDLFGNISEIITQNEIKIMKNVPTNLRNLTT